MAQLDALFAFTLFVEQAIPILILSCHSELHYQRRTACRATWIPLLRPEFRPVFILGAPRLPQPWQWEGDILRVRSEDGYNHLVEKSILGYKALLERYDFPWMFKCDDDTWINPWRFNSYPFWEWDQVGHITWAPEDYASGAGYSLSRRAVQEILNYTSVVPPTYESEDKEFGGIIRRLPGVRRHHEPAILPWSGTTWQPCLLGHYLRTPEEMSAFHAQAMEAELFPASCAHERI